MDHTDRTYSADHLNAVLGTHAAPTLIDVCIPEDIAADPWRLPGAVHCPHTQLRTWVTQSAPMGDIVVICQKGLKLSQGAAATLRAWGLAAKALEGGNLAWFGAHRPRLALDRAPAPGTPWVLPVGWDMKAVLSVWLIRRWFDPGADLLWVPAAHVTAVADRFDGQALPTGQGWRACCAALGLDHAPLAHFLDRFDTAQAFEAPLLAALSKLHTSEEECTAASLTLVDTAWAAYRAQEEDGQ